MFLRRGLSESSGFKRASKRPRHSSLSTFVLLFSAYPTNGFTPRDRLYFHLGSTARRIGHRLAAWEGSLLECHPGVVATDTKDFCHFADDT